MGPRPDWSLTRASHSRAVRLCTDRRRDPSPCAEPRPSSRRRRNGAPSPRLRPRFFPRVPGPGCLQEANQAPLARGESARRALACHRPAPRDRARPTRLGAGYRSGRAVVVSKSRSVIKPFEVMPCLLDGRMTGEAWQRICDEAGIGGVDLRDAAAPEAEIDGTAAPHGSIKSGAP